MLQEDYIKIMEIIKLALNANRNIQTLTMNNKIKALIISQKPSPYNYRGSKFVSKSNQTI